MKTNRRVKSIYSVSWWAIYEKHLHFFLHSISVIQLPIWIMYVFSYISNLSHIVSFGAPYIRLTVILIISATISSQPHYLLYSCVVPLMKCPRRCCSRLLKSITSLHWPHLISVATPWGCISALSQLRAVHVTFSKSNKGRQLCKNCAPGRSDIF